MHRAPAIALLATLMGSLVAHGAALPQGHPLVSAYPDSVLSKSDLVAFDDYQRIVGMRDDASLTETLSGKITRLTYRSPAGRSTQEIVANYRQALEGAGLKVDYECASGKACASSGIGWRKIPSWNKINGMNVGALADVRYFSGRLDYQGQIAYVSVAANPSVHHVHVVEVKPMQQGLVVANAAALASALDRDGRVVVDGIYFDSDSARLQAASDAALEQVAKLLQERPALRLYIVGHTDDQGSLTHNQTLSTARARSVAEALGGRFGIAADRLAAHGVGPLAPAASNADEPGRARNRRVEIVAR